MTTTMRCVGPEGLPGEGVCEDDGGGGACFCVCLNVLVVLFEMDGELLLKCGFGAILREVPRPSWLGVGTLMV